MALNTSKLHCNELASDFRYVPTEIGTLSNGFSRVEASNLVVFELLQSRRPGNRRKLVANFRSMAQCH
ncbi:hypothetical protein HAH_4022 [Haloarcula hispanica ATCC 33960]|uniref:Uncharacterized protein n=1 Tax=Haloarcula hispanica (strain ATCC 33960 / DSM 4426 / JCM 8911 / NBRC 102182 / NCIMB 2187 / VKM B-1755) TaxID=634497 RepID=G0HZA1_HALHT|nr:hypothetical protein HAH_4022 [Haloarcula hispanica ATCC 33960]